MLDTGGEGECTQKEHKGCQTASASAAEGYVGADMLGYFCCDITRVSN